MRNRSIGAIRNVRHEHVVAEHSTERDVVEVRFGQTGCRRPRHFDIANRGHDPSSFFWFGSGLV